MPPNPSSPIPFLFLLFLRMLGRFMHLSHFSLIMHFSSICLCDTHDRLVRVPYLRIFVKQILHIFLTFYDPMQMLSISPGE